MKRYNDYNFYTILHGMKILMMEMIVYSCFMIFVLSVFLGQDIILCRGTELNVLVICFLYYIFQRKCINREPINSLLSSSKVFKNDAETVPGVYHSTNTQLSIRLFF